MKIYDKIFTKIGEVYSLLWDTVHVLPEIQLPEEETEPVSIIPNVPNSVHPWFESYGEDDGV